MAILDVAKFWENYLELKDVVPILIEKFRSTYVENIRKIKIALDSKDPEALRIAAHGLKGMLLQLYAPPAAAMASQLEMSGKAKNLDGTAECFEQLLKDLEVLETELTELLKSADAA